MSAHKFTHSICVKCWNRMKPSFHTTEQGGGPIEICCFCGEETREGIYVRAAPEEPGHCPEEWPEDEHSG